MGWIRVVVGAVALSVLVPGATAQGAVSSAFDGKVPCRTSAVAADAGVRICTGGASALALSFDGTPIDVNLVLPAEPDSGPDGGFPLIGSFHGYGSTKTATSTGPAARKMVEWAKRGYAVFSMTARGWGQSCGPQSAVRQTPACAAGHNHLMDTRYEVRDAQTLMGQLADQQVGQGRYLVDGQRIGANGGSYGGGMTLALSMLRNRIMLPDGGYAPWLTPRTRRPMQIAVGTASVPWSDLAYALAPNGRTLDYANRVGDDTGVGVVKQTYVTSLFAASVARSTLTPPGLDPGADLISWYATLTAGEPYLAPAAAIADELRRFHSAMGIDRSVQPAPLLISSGGTDDLFPVDEAIRLRNAIRADHPHAFVAIQAHDAGHARSSGRHNGRALLRQQALLEHFLTGSGATPTDEVQAGLQHCGGTDDPVLRAPTWAALAPGELRHTVAAPQVVTGSGHATAGTTFDPVAGRPGSALALLPTDVPAELPDDDQPYPACAVAGRGNAPGTAVVRFPTVPAGAVRTLAGSPTIQASVLSTSPNNQLAARLLDVLPDGTERLVARGLLRPRTITSGIPVQEVFQLHANVYRFAAGHTPKVELLTADAPYGRPSNGQTPIVVSHVSVRLPVHEAPDGRDVLAPAPKTVPPGYVLAPDFGGPTAAGPAT